jgi:hypothetical protein
MNQFQVCVGRKISIRVRGKYKPPGDNSIERPLHLYITADDPNDLEYVVSKLEDIAKRGEMTAPVPVHYPIIFRNSHF